MTLQANVYVVVRGKDSLIELPLTQEGEIVPSDGITRCDLVFKREGVADLVLSSSTQPTWFALQAPAVIDGLDVTMIRANLKDIPSPPTNGRYKVDVYLYDAEFTNGRLWATLDVEIRPAAPVP